MRVYRIGDEYYVLDVHEMCARYPSATEGARWLGVSRAAWWRYATGSAHPRDARVDQIWREHQDLFAPVPIKKNDTHVKKNARSA